MILRNPIRDVLHRTTSSHLIFPINQIKHKGHLWSWPINHLTSSRQSYQTAGFCGADRRVFSTLQELPDKQIVKTDSWLIALSPFWLFKKTQYGCNVKQSGKGWPSHRSTFTIIYNQRRTSVKMILMKAQFGFHSTSVITLSERTTRSWLIYQACWPGLDPVTSRVIMLLNLFAFITIGTAVCWRWFSISVEAWL